MSTRLTAQKIGGTAIIVTIVAFLGVLAFIVSPDFFKNRLDPEVFKLTYQFLLLTVIGAAITFLFSFYTKARDERKEERILQLKFYNDFSQAYNDGKEIRRFLRARARKRVDNPEEKAIHIKTAQYDELMQKLTTLQLKFEFLHDEVISNKDLFSATGEAERLIVNLENIEKYLNKMVGEYEKCFELYPNQYFIDEVSYFPLDKLDLSLIHI